jgi:hypothetical protein
MNEFNEFKEMFMVVGVLVRCTHAIGMAMPPRPPKPTSEQTGRPPAVAIAGARRTRLDDVFRT